MYVKGFTHTARYGRGGAGFHPSPFVTLSKQSKDKEHNKYILVLSTRILKNENKLYANTMWNLARICIFGELDTLCKSKQKNDLTILARNE